LVLLDGQGYGQVGGICDYYAGENETTIQGVMGSHSKSVFQILFWLKAEKTMLGTF
jgi:hypothetical protein